MPTPILVLAGNASQAAMYCRDHGISLHDARYVMSPEQVRGYKTPLYAVVGTFWNSPRSIEIWKALVSCYVGSGQPVPVAPPEIEPFLHPTLPSAPAPTIANPPAGNVVSSILKIANMMSQGFPMIPNPTPDEDVLQPIEEDLPKLKRKKKVEFKRIRP